MFDPANEITLGKPELCTLGFRQFVPWFLGSKSCRIWIELPPGHSSPSKEVLCVPIVYDQLELKKLENLFSKCELRVYRKSFSIVGSLSHRSSI